VDINKFQHWSEIERLEKKWKAEQRMRNKWEEVLAAE
jgi:hypothetical protein